METQTLKLPEVATRLSCSVSQVRKLIRAQAFPTVRIGHGLRVPEDALRKFIDGGGVTIRKGSDGSEPSSVSAS